MISTTSTIQVLTLLLWIKSAFGQLLSTSTTPSLNVTTIAGRDGASVIECWSIPEFTTSADAGTTGALNLFLGEVDNATYTVIPPRFDGGLHNAPAAQFVFFVTGLGHVTLPNVTELTPANQFWLQGGKYGLVLALDTAAVSHYGHFTTYPSAADSIVLQMPLKKNYLTELEKEATVLYDGPCVWNEMTGI